MTAPRILLVEDSEQYQLTVRAALGDGFRVDCASSVAQASRLIDSADYDLFILDVMLPDGDGFRLCASLREEKRTRQVPVLFLTGKTEVEDRILGFTIGAEDYITKPFEPREFKARVSARIRRLREAAAAQRLLTSGRLRIDLGRQRAYWLSPSAPDKELNLTPLEYRILQVLVEREGQVLSRDELLKTAWGETHVADRTIDRHVSSLRKKLGSGADCIETVSGAGYRYRADAASANAA